jgi:hypothetical protein
VSAATALYVVAASAYAGFQWLVHLVVYRSYDMVRPEAFPAFERAHIRRITPIVVVLFGLLLVATATLLAVGRRDVGIAAAVLLAALLGVTTFGAAPAHGRLVQRYDGDVLRRLLRVDAVRTGIATLQLALAVVAALT